MLWSCMLKNECDCESSWSDPSGGKMKHVHPVGDVLSAFDCSPTYFNEYSRSCYWFNSRGLSLYISGRSEVSGDKCSVTFPGMIDSVFGYVCSNEDINIARFSDNLLSKIREVFTLECDRNENITLLIPWKSIALIILSGRNSGVSDIAVTIGSREYTILC